MTVSPQGVTQLLVAWRGGDQQALDKLIPLVYDELRRIASRYMKRNILVTLCRPPRWSTKRTCEWSASRMLTGKIVRTFSE